MDRLRAERTYFNSVATDLEITRANFVFCWGIRESIASILARRTAIDANRFCQHFGMWVVTSCEICPDSSWRFRLLHLEIPDCGGYPEKYADTTGYDSGRGPGVRIRQDISA